MTNDKSEPQGKKRPPIGGIQQQSQYATIGGAKRSEVQNARLPDVENGTIPEGQQSKVPEAEQSKVPDKESARMPEVQTLEKPKVQQSKRKQHTVYLSPALSKWVKLQAVEEDREISEIMEDALKLYRDQVS